jgi:hypothetical protein
MSVFTSIYFDLNKKIDKDNKNTNVNNKIPEKNMINTIEKKVDEVFSNMKKRKSNTNFQIDYPWLTI